MKVESEVEVDAEVEKDRAVKNFTELTFWPSGYWLVAKSRRPSSHKTSQVKLAMLDCHNCTGMLRPEACAGIYSIHPAQ